MCGVVWFHCARALGPSGPGPPDRTHPKKGENERVTGLHNTHAAHALCVAVCALSAECVVARPVGGPYR